MKDAHTQNTVLNDVWTQLHLSDFTCKVTDIVFWYKTILIFHPAIP